MNRDELQDDLIELGIASVETKGGPMGVTLDAERTKWYHGIGLTDD